MCQPSLRPRGIMPVLSRRSIRALRRMKALINKFGAIGAIRRRIPQVNKFGGQWRKWSNCSTPVFCLGLGGWSNSCLMLRRVRPKSYRNDFPVSATPAGEAGLRAEKLVGDLSFETRPVSVACRQSLRQVTLCTEVCTFIEMRYAQRYARSAPSSR